MAHHILIVDDDPDNRAIAAAILQANGYTVTLAVNGIEGLECAGRIKPDLILLDLSMPKLDGWSTVKQLRTIPGLKTIPVIAFTAHAMTGDEQRAIKAGCDDYITKPCMPKQITEAVGKWLSRKASS